MSKALSSPKTDLRRPDIPRSEVLTKGFHFFKRDFLQAISYKLQFSMTMIGVAVQVMMFYFLSQAITPSPGMREAFQGQSYFAFALIGVSTQGLLFSSLNSFSQALRSEQMMGTIEVLLMSPTKIGSLIWYGSIWNLFMTLGITASVVVTSSFLGVDFSNVNLLSVLVILALLILTAVGIGMISAGIIMVVKEGDPVVWLLTTFSSLFSGTIYPIETLPKSLQGISRLMPLTYALEAIRPAVYSGASLADLKITIFQLALFTGLALSLGMFSWKKGYQIAKRNGSIAHY